jgi:ribonuclease J
MKLTIHRGAKEIGGSCVEISTEKTRVLFDLGQPLTDEKVELSPAHKNVEAVLVSHPHQDHFSLIEDMPPSVPVYLGELSEKFIQATRIFLGKPQLSNSFRYFEAWKKFSVGDLDITPYLVDHSATDAYSFLIEANGKRIFYSGDFRAHGRKAKLFDRMIQNPVKNVDALLMEGTMLGRDNKDFPNESAVEKEMIKTLKNESGPAFLLSSSQNIDRIVSAYRACVQSGRIFVIDIYTAWILRELSSSANTKATPDISWEKIRVLSKGGTAGRHYEKLKSNPDYFGQFVKEIYDARNVITEDELARQPGKYFIKTSYAERLIKNLKASHATVIYSMWQGYLTEEHNSNGYQRLERLQNAFNINFVYIHTSGHATTEDLQSFATAMNPQKLIPIHTEHANEYKKYFNNVKIIKDGEETAL